MKHGTILVILCNRRPLPSLSSPFPQVLPDLQVLAACIGYRPLQQCTTTPPLLIAGSAAWTAQLCWRRVWLSWNWRMPRCAVSCACSPELLRRLLAPLHPWRRRPPQRPKLRSWHLRLCLQLQQCLGPCCLGCRRQRCSLQLWALHTARPRRSEGSACSARFKQLQVMQGPPSDALVSTAFACVTSGGQWRNACGAR